MYPILFEFGPVKIYSYGLMLALAFIVATLLARSEAQRKGINPEKILNLSLGLVISGVLGARLLYILQNLSFYLRYPQQVFMLHKGGLSFYGGFILATIYAVIFLKTAHLSVIRTLGIISPYLALGQAIGRVGCFLNGCCYGEPTDFFFAVYFPGQNVARHPVQIYNSLNLLLIFIILRILQSRKLKKVHFSGQIFLLYCLLYSVMRFFMEYLRGDNFPVWAGLTMHQLISLAIIVISGIFLWRDERITSPSRR